MHFNETTPPRILPPKVTAARLGLSDRTVQRLVAAGNFVEPVRVSKNRIGFLEESVNNWIATRPVVSLTPKVEITPAPREEAIILPEDTAPRPGVHVRTVKRGVDPGLKRIASRPEAE